MKLTLKALKSGNKGTTPALAGRDYAAAAKRFAATVGQGGPRALDARIYQAFALMMADKTAEAGAILATVKVAPAADQREALRWLRAMVGGETR